MFFNEDIHYAEDALFVYSYLYYAERVCSIQEPFYQYNITREGSITGANDERMLHIVQACAELTKFYISTGHFEELQGDLLQICIGFWARKFYRFHEHPVKKEICCRFVCAFYDFLDIYYPEWKKALRAYATNGSRRKYRINFYKTNRFLTRCYIYALSGLIRFVRNIKQSLRA